MRRRPTQVETYLVIEHHALSLPSSPSQLACQVASHPVHALIAQKIVLIHGAWHTPLVWEPVRALLEAAGHRVHVPDLPFDSTDRLAGDCAEIVIALGDLSAAVIVSHTSGALVTPLVAAATPVAALAFVNPLLPEIGRSFAQQAEDPEWHDRGSVGRRYDRDARSFWHDESDFTKCLAADCSPDQVAALWGQLRPQSRAVLREVTPLKAWPDAPSAAWIYEDDADIAVSWMTSTVRARLGIEPELRPGSQLGFYADPEPLAEWILGQLPA